MANMCASRFKNIGVTVFKVCKSVHILEFSVDKLANIHIHFVGHIRVSLTKAKERCDSEYCACSGLNYRQKDTHDRH